jgi:hypothetical protein
MTVVYLSSLSEITGISQNGLLKPEQLTNVKCSMHATVIKDAAISVIIRFE